MVGVKICGLTSEADLEAAIDFGADCVGLVLVETSPRFVPFDKAQALIRRAADLGAEPWVVAAFSPSGGPNTPWLEKLVEETPEIGAVQLHGRETPQDVAAFAKRHPLVPIVKAIGVAGKRDLEAAARFEAADAFLFDAKPPAGATREGGHGRSFNWSILKGLRIAGHEDWTLSGGLTPDNVAEAIRQSGAAQVDVSSGVEASAGVKDLAKVRAFIDAAKGR